MPYGWLLNAARRWPDRPAIVHDGKAVTYRDLLAAARATAGLLRRHGVGPGDRVAIQMPASPLYVAALCGADAAGAAILPLDPTLKPAETDDYCSRAGAGLVLVEPGWRRPPAPPAVQRLPAPALDELKSMPPLAPEESGQWPPAPDTYLLLLMSSGTLGRPKVVARLRSQVRGHHQAFGTAMPVSEHDRMLCVLPLFHAAGMFEGLVEALAAGCTLYLEAFSPRTLAATIEREAITVMPAAPIIYKMLVETDFSTPPRLSSLRRASSGTALFPPELGKAMLEKYGIRVIVIYGSTETGAITAGLPPRESPERGWVGRPLPGVTVQVWDPDGKPLPPGQEGAIAVRGPAVASCYLDDPEATAATFRNGYALTGDVGYCTPDGEVYLVGRQKAAISVGGKKVSPEEVEAVLRQHPQVSEALVMAAQGADGEEFVQAYIEARGEVTPGQLRAFCAERLAPHKVPNRFAFVQRLPRSSTGKVLRRPPQGIAGTQTG